MDVLPHKVLPAARYAGLKAHSKQGLEFNHHEEHGGRPWYSSPLFLS